MKKSNNFFYLTLFAFIFSILQSCQSDFDSDTSKNENNTTPATTEAIQTFESNDLSQMQEFLESQGIITQTDSTENETRGLFLSDPCIQAIKVSCKTPNPNNDGTYVDMSGVLLVPKKTILTDLANFRLMVVTPATYTENSQAPSNTFKKISLVTKDKDLNLFYFYTLQAKSGYAVLIPDYLGFGDSHGQCVHPYLEVKPMLQSIINLIKATKSTLSANGYRYKKEIVVTGYSQGAFIAASLGRELETNYASTMPVNLLFTGGTPCNLKQITDIVRASSSLKFTYFIPYALWGFQQNGYPSIKIEDVLKEPYASILGDVFNGDNNSVDVNNSFPNKIEDLYTEKFIKDLDTDPNLAYMNKILDENSLKPWINKCRFVMTHGVSDVSVYYQNAKDFADQQNAAGGKVTFYSTVGDHIAATIPYYAKASSFYASYR